MMHALDPAVHGPLFATIEHLIPPPKPHPLGCHRRRIPDRVCLLAMLLRLVHGLSWESTENMMRIAGYKVSDTTLRARRKEWVDAGVFEQIAAHAVVGYHRLIGFNLERVCIDGSDQLAPCGGEGAGHSFKRPGRLAWKWCIAVDADGIPMAWNIGPGNRNDYAMLFPLLDQLRDRELTRQIGVLHADRGFNYAETPDRVSTYGITNFVAPPRNKRGRGAITLVGMGPRWIVESANSWLCNYGQLRRNTDRCSEHRHAALCFAIALFITHRLTTRNSPIR